MQSTTDAAAPDPWNANGHASAEASDAAQLAPLPKNPLWKNESAVLSFVTTLIGGVHANVADQLDPSVLAQLSMTSLYAHIEEQLGAVAGVDYDKAWLRTKVDQIMFRNTTGASVVESSLEELPVRTPTSLAWGGGGGERGGGGGGGGAAAAAAAAQAAGAAAAAAASRATAAAERRRREAREKRAAADRRARLDAAVSAEAARAAAAVDGGGGGDGCGIREISSATAGVCAAPEVSTAVGRPVVAAPAAELAAAAEYIARRQAAVDSTAAPATAVAGATAGAQRANAYNVASSAAALSGCLAAAAPAAVAAAAVAAAP